MSYPPALLWLGPLDTLISRAEKYLMSIWCVHNSCGTCSNCVKIKDHQYHSLLWLTPEKQAYTVNQINGMLHAISFARDSGDHFYTVFENAALLSTSTAHKLLKPLEEPLYNYHFLLLAESANTLLPTIVSRCVVQDFWHELLGQERKKFLDIFFAVPIDLAQVHHLIEHECPSEAETRKLVELLLAHWLEQSRTKNAHALKAVEIIGNLYDAHPMPGSAKLFWRTMALRLAAL